MQSRTHSGVAAAMKISLKELIDEEAFLVSSLTTLTIELKINKLKRQSSKERKENSVRT